jgi:two-component system, NtrC family, C4-dicarboxylate transport sensor histidine kinase DctB
MKIMGYKNIARSIMISTILLILFNTLLISLFYYQNQLKEYEETLLALRYEHINQQKNILKKDVNQLVSMIKYKYGGDIQNHKEEVISFLRSLKVNIDQGNYVFVYALIKKQGGDGFARMVLNPNRLDLQGKLLSTYYKDSKGFAFRQAFLDGINKNGEAFVKYDYKKTNGTIGEKISYFYYLEPLNWVIAKGIYIDDIKKQLELKKKELEHRVQVQIKQNLFFFLFFSIIAIIIAYIIGKKTQSVIILKDKRVKQTTKALTDLNRELDNRVKKAIEKNKEQQKILMQKSKFIALGEMISLIAHQWRQPISELNAIILNIKFHHKMKMLDEETMAKKTKEMEHLLEYMSTTIDDFRTFFKPNKTKEKFYFYTSIQRINEIIKTVFKEHHITIEEKIDESLYLINYQNEFEQVMLNLLNNAKDALIADNISFPKVTIEVLKQNGRIMINICDNANGIDESILDKIFDPYFTTKEESDGTGIGLYMSKMIIEENMGGVLKVQSSQQGTCFSIVFMK